MPDGGGAGDKPRTLWIGDLGYWMDETFLYNLFAATGTVTSVKIIRSKTTNVSEGYGFIEFTSHEAAAQVRACPCCFASLLTWLDGTAEQTGCALAAHADLVRGGCAFPADTQHLQRVPHPGHGPNIQAQLGGLWRRQGQHRGCGAPT